jgi:hypothetical protein
VDQSLHFLETPLPGGFRRRTIHVPEGAELPYAAEEWKGALVVLKEGEIEVECTRGTRMRFLAGDVLWLAGMPLRSFRSLGPGPALVVAISRTMEDE